MFDVGITLGSYYFLIIHFEFTVLRLTGISKKTEHRIKYDKVFTGY